MCSVGVMTEEVIVLAPWELQGSVDTLLALNGSVTPLPLIDVDGDAHLYSPDKIVQQLIVEGVDALNTTLPPSPIDDILDVGDAGTTVLEAGMEIVGPFQLSQ